MREAHKRGDSTITPIETNGEAKFEVSVHAPDPNRVREWVEENLSKQVTSIVAYALDDGFYRIFLFVKDENSAILAKVFWGSSKSD